jgi:CubicO group peptidase (beta-lactamase class C family)
MMLEKGAAMTMPAPLPRSTPENQGVSSASILSFLDGVESVIQDLHGFMYLRHGAVVAEGWWRPYRPDIQHMLFSLSKSFTSTAVGFAVSEGLLSVEAPVLSFFPKDAPRKPSPNLMAMKVRHLLTMTTGHDKDAMEATFKGGLRPERAFLALPVDHEPGTHFVYNTAATFMLSSIVQRLTGTTLTDYLTPRLFEPLGIQDPVWERHPNGVDFGGFGLSVRTEDIARFGQLYLDRGMWNGKRVVPEAWVAEATARQVPNGDAPDSDWSQGYGYQFWRCRPRGVYRGDGAFGQYCIVMPEQDAVIAINAGLGDMQAPLTRIWERLLPGMAEAPLPASPDTAALAERLRSLSCQPPAGERSRPEAAAISGAEYVFEKNPLGITGVSLAPGADSSVLTLWFGRLRSPVTLGWGQWRDGSMRQPRDHRRGSETHAVAAAGSWTTSDVFTAVIRQLDTPNALTVRAGARSCELELNVSFGPDNERRVLGKRRGA